MNIVDFNPLSLIDFPGRLSAVVFTRGCNLRCRFCYNPELVLNSLGKDVENEVFSYIRENIIDTVVLTGGEPLLNDDCEMLLIKLRKQNLTIKLDTNGSLPDKLSSVLEKNLIDYVSLDLKGFNTEDIRYITRNRIFTLSLFIKTLKILKSYKKQTKLSSKPIDFNFEIRLTLWKPYEDSDFLTFLEILNENSIVLDDNEYIIIQRLNLNDKLLDKTFRNNKLAKLASSDNYFEKIKKNLENVKNIKFR
jgi:pyruvate formate lyase activating enzyme